MMHQQAAQRKRYHVMTTAGWWLILILAGGMAVYALAHVVLGARVYRATVAASLIAHPWGIYVHAFFGSIASAIGPVQFLAAVRQRQPGLHRIVGRVYVVAALLAGASGLYMGLHAFGGPLARLGFVCGALATLLTTALGYRTARQRQWAAHRAWMIRSYAMIFSAVTFRLVVLLVLLVRHDDFASAYLVAAWLSWVLHLAVVEWWVRRGAAVGGISTN